MAFEGSYVFDDSYWYKPININKSGIILSTIFFYHTVVGLSCLWMKILLLFNLFIYFHISQSKAVLENLENEFYFFLCL